MSVHLDPQEVLYHLQQLGFSDVTPEQLADFMRDLKRLINHDRQKQCSCRCTCQAQHSSASSGSSYLETSSSSGSNLSLQPAEEQENVCAPLRPPSRIRKTTLTLSDADENRSEFASVCSSTTSTQAHASSKNVKAGPKRIKSTFIRPWQVGSTNVGRRSDPVTLYHHYQALWSKQSFPGEDDHADLRWTIRHRMLGQNPHPSPRGLMQAMSHESLGRRRPRL